MVYVFLVRWQFVWKIKRSSNDGTHLGQWWIMQIKVNLWFLCTCILQRNNKRKKNENAAVRMARCRERKRGRERESEDSKVIKRWNRWEIPILEGREISVRSTKRFRFLTDFLLPLECYIHFYLNLDFFMFLLLSVLPRFDVFFFFLFAYSCVFVEGPNFVASQHGIKRGR